MVLLFTRVVRKMPCLHEHLTSTAITHEIDFLGVQKIKEGGDSSGRKKAKAYSCEEAGG